MDDALMPPAGLQRLEQAVALHQAGQLEQAAALYQALITESPNAADPKHLLGLIEQERGNFANAEGLIRQAIELDPNQGLFWVNLGLGFCKQQHWSAAADALRRAIELDPEHMNLLGKLAEIYIAMDATSACEDYLQALTNKVGPQAPIACAKARLYAHQRLLPQAVAACQQALAQAPDCIDALALLANLYTEQDQWPQAASTLRQALLLLPNSAGLHYNLANVLRSQNELAAATASYQQALAIAPKFVEAWNNLAQTWAARNNLQQAEAAYLKGIQAAPEHSVCYYNLANQYQAQDQLQEAIGLYQKVLALDPTHTRALNNLATCYHKHLDLQAAFACLQQLNQLAPDVAAHLYNYGAVALDVGQYQVAIEALNQALQCDPTYPLARSRLYLAKRMVCDWQHLAQLSEEIEQTLKHIDTTAHTLPVETPLQNILRNAAYSDNYRLANQWAQGLLNQIPHQEVSFNHDPGTRQGGIIRIGYVSSDIKNHATMHLIRQLFALHDRGQFQIWLFSYGENDQSEYRRQAERDCDHFIDIKDHTDEAAAQLIYNSQIDILVDLKGYSFGSRTGIVSRRPAPVLVNYLGFPGTCGQGLYDYIIGDKVVTPLEEAKYFGERLALLPHCYQLTDNQQVIAAAPPTVAWPASNCYYACFCHTKKIDPRVFEAWMQILQRVPNSHLILYAPHNPLAKANLTQHAARFGITAEKFIFVDYLDKPQHLARMQLTDVILDTWDYNGHTTTTDALWAGVPCVAKLGQHFASRVSASLLQQCDMGELVAQSAAQYVDIAVRMGQDKPYRDKIRQHLAQAKAGAALFDTKQTVQDLERLYQQMWQTYTQAMQPQAITIAALTSAV